MDLALIWFGIIGLGVLIYVVLDGFDLGIGMLFPFIKNKDERDAMMNTVAPVWDGNETWMVLGGAGLFAAFPLVYSTVLSALYLPITLMAIALIFRGVAFEFRFKAKNPTFWDYAFIWGSILAGFLQGVILGAIVQGIHTENGIYAGNTFDWLTPFSLFVGLCVVVMYATLGGAWLVMKTDGSLQQRLYQLMPKLLFALIVVFVGVLLFSPMVDSHFANRWFNHYNWVIFLALLLVALAIFWQIITACYQQNECKPFVYTLLLMLVAFVGLVLSLFPFLIPPSVDIWTAAAPQSSLKFALIGAAIFLPAILIYTAYSYWVFRGKVRAGDQGYH